MIKQQLHRQLAYISRLTQELGFRLTPNLTNISYEFNVNSPLFLFFFFLNDTATTEIYTLSLHDALPISHPPGADVLPRRAQCDAAELLHLRHDADAERPGPLAPAGAGPGAAAARPVARRPDALAAHVVHGQTPLRRGVVGDRELARRPGVGDRRALPPAPHRALHQFRVVRRRLLERVGPGERPAPADDSRLRHERQSAATNTRRAAAALFPHQAPPQTSQGPGLHVVTRITA